MRGGAGVAPAAVELDVEPRDGVAAAALEGEVVEAGEVWLVGDQGGQDGGEGDEEGGAEVGA